MFTGEATWRRCWWWGLRCWEYPLTYGAAHIPHVAGVHNASFRQHFRTHELVESPHPIAGLLRGILLAPRVAPGPHSATS